MTSLQTLDIMFLKNTYGFDMFDLMPWNYKRKPSKSVDSYWKPRCFYSFFKSNFLFGHLLIKYIELLFFELKIESCNPCIYSFYNHWGDRFIKKKIGLLNLQLRNCIILSVTSCLQLRLLHKAWEIRVSDTLWIIVIID